MSKLHTQLCQVFPFWADFFIFLTVRIPPILDPDKSQVPDVFRHWSSDPPPPETLRWVDTSQCSCLRAQLLSLGYITSLVGDMVHRKDKVKGQRTVQPEMTIIPITTTMSGERCYSWNRTSPTNNRGTVSTSSSRFRCTTMLLTVGI